MDDKIFDALYYDLMGHCVAFTRSALAKFIDNDGLIELLSDQIDRDMADLTMNLLSEIYEIDELDPVKLSESLGSGWGNALNAATVNLSFDTINAASQSESYLLLKIIRLIGDGSIQFESESLSIIKKCLERIEH